jgi:hypothetical protein
MAETFVPIGYEILLRENKSDNESETFLAAVSATDGTTCDSTLNENEGASDLIEVGTKSEPTAADDEYNVTLPRRADSVARAAVDVTGTDFTSYQRDEEGTSNNPTIAISSYEQRRVRNPVQFEATRKRRNETRRLDRAKKKIGKQKKRKKRYIPMNERTEEEVKKARLEWCIRSKRYRDRKKGLNGRTEYGEIQIDNEESHHRDHDEETHEEQKRGKYKEEEKGKHKEEEKGKYKEEDGKHIDHIDEEKEEGNSSEHDEVMYPSDISIIDLVTPTKKKGTNSAVVSEIASNHKKHFHANPVVYKIKFAKDCDEEYERCISACNTLKSAPEIGEEFDMELNEMKQRIESGDETQQWTIQLYHGRGLANPATKMSDRDLRNLLTPGAFVTDAVVYFYSAQLLNRDLAMIRQKPGRKRCWIYSPHFMTRLGREDESVSGYKYTDAINRWGTRVPGT